VADVAVGQKISAIADPRLAISFRAAVNCAELAKGIFVANFQIVGSPAYFKSCVCCPIEQ
jgi:hypothetical protein